MELIIPIVIILGLLFISAFFSGGELALMALDPISLETRARQGSLLARLQQRLRSRPQRFLSTILIGYNVANIALTAYVTWLAIQYLASVEGWTEPRAALFSTVCVTVAIIVFAELMPKTVAAISTVRTASLVTLPIYVLDTLMTPFTWAIEKTVMPMVYLLAGRRGGIEQQVRRADVVTAIGMAHAGGELHRSDMRVAHQALHFSTKDLHDVMTPRVDLIAIDQHCTVGTALDLMTDTGFTRLPIYGDGLDEIHGVLLLKDLVRISLRAAHGGRDPKDHWVDLPAKPYRRDVVQLPETKSAVDTLSLMQRQHIQMVVVVDEHGGTAGVVTMEDILEELVGEIRDESDHIASAEVLRRTPDAVVITGRARLDQLPELESVDLGETESTTVGGLMMERLGRPAVVGDVIELGAVRIEALKVLRNRIKVLKVSVPPAPAIGDG